MTHLKVIVISCLGMTKQLLYVHVTVHRNIFLFNKTNKTHEFPNFWGSKKLHMFRAFPLLIIRISLLYIRHWYISCSVDDSFKAGSGTILTLLGSCHHTCKKYTNAECTVENSWWWAKKMSETCRVFGQKILGNSCVSLVLLKRKQSLFVLHHLSQFVCVCVCVCLCVHVFPWFFIRFTSRYALRLPSYSLAMNCKAIWWPMNLLLFS